MRIEQLQYIVEIADSGSVSAAAERLHTSQPSISQSIASFEKEINAKIFKRSRFGSQPTEIGELIIENARKVLHQVNELKKSVQTHNPLLTGSLSLSAVPTLCLTILPRALSIFKNRYPDVDIEIHEEGAKIVTQQVLADKVELGLIAARNEIDPRLTFESLMQSQIKVCVSKHSPLANRKEVSLKEIIKYPIVTFNKNYQMHTFLLSKLKTYGQPNILFYSENSEAAKKVISENLSVGFYTDIALITDPYILSGKLIPLLIKEERNSYSTLGIIYKKNTSVSVSAQKFIEEIRIQTSYFKRLYNLPDIL